MSELASIKNNEHKKHLFLIDGYGFVFRAYHAMPPLTRDDGTPVGAVYGFTNMIMKLKNRTEIDNGHHMLVVFDAGGKTFRNDIYPEYKANRPPAPEDLIPQFPIVREAAEALGLPQISMKGYEADDIIATYTKMAVKQGMKVTVISSDKDLMQLVGDDVEMYDAMKDKRIGIQEVEDKFGVEPVKVLDLLALMGDSADNIPGVPGIGPKTAAQLLGNFGTLEGILANAEYIKQKKRRESLIEFADQARLSLELAKLCYDVPVDGNIEDFAVKEENPDEILDFLRKQGFRSLVTRFEKKHGREGEAYNIATATVKKVANNNQNQQSFHEVISDIKVLENWLSNVKKTGKLVIISEVDKKGNYLSISLSYDENISCNIPLILDENKEEQGDLFSNEAVSTEKKSISIDEVGEVLRGILTDNAILKIGHNIKDVMKLFNCEIETYDDTMLISYILDGSKHKHDVVNLAQMHLGIEPNEDDNSRVAELVFQLNKFLRQRLFNEKMLTIYETIERPLIDILDNMEKAGFRLDSKELTNLSQDFGDRLKNLERDIYSLAGREFNIASPKQLGEILFDDMNIEGGKKSKSGAYKTGVEVLEKLSDEGHNIAEKIINWRMLSKLITTYTNALGKQVDIKTGRVHTNFNMTATSTGRLSSSNPNLQNIPIRSSDGRRIRNAFVADKGNLLISADYSQIELRLLAHIAEIDTLKTAFKEGRDIHTLTASQVIGVPIENVDADMRRSAKAINFGIIYGQSAFGLAKQLGVGRKEAAEYIEAYFTQYPGIKSYMEETKEFARENGYVTTLYGRKCYMNGIGDRNGARRAFAERAAINAPIQGTAADIIKMAMIKVNRVLNSLIKVNAKMLLQVHDELVIEVPEKNVEEISSLVKKEMEQVVSLSIPLTVEVNSGSDWGSIH